MQYEFPVFEQLCPSWDQAIHLATRQAYARGSLILDMEAPARGIYYVKEGQVDTALYTLHGPEKVLYCIGRGCLFGEACCFSTGITGEASVWARTDCTLYFFRKETIEGPIAREYPHLLVEMVGMLGHIVRMYGIWLQDSLTQDYFGRVCRILVYFVRWKKGPDAAAARQVTIQSDVTQNDIAKLLGVHRVTVTKAVARLKELGIIRRFTKTELDIADFPGLCRLAGREEGPGAPVG
jgi:CRP-like cAMP-binding protein